MNTSNYISSLALLVSVVSLIISWHFGFRDKSKLKTYAKFYPSHPNHDRAKIEIKIVNHGRRATILTLFGGDLEDGGMSGIYLGKEGDGLRLGEHEKYETIVYADDLLVTHPEGNIAQFVRFWFEDTLGQRHKIKNSEKLISKLISV